MFRTPGWFTRTPIAHRGLHDRTIGVPENSMAAFRRAFAAGYGIECDVRLSRDGVVMVFHDATLKRVCGRPERIDALTAAELQAVPLLGTAERIPTLAQLCAAAAGRHPLVIEIKNMSDRDIGRLEMAVRRQLADYRGPVAVMSFNPLSVDWFRRHAPSLTRGIVAEATPFGRTLHQRLILRTALARGLGDPDFVSFKIDDLPHPWTSALRRRGLPIMTWTVRRHDQRVRAHAHADNVTFERKPGF